MNRLCQAALLTAAWASCNITMQLLGQAAPPPTNSEPATVKVYKAGGKVSAPALIPRDFPEMITTGCEQSGSKTIELSMIVDGSGTPRNIAFLHPAGGDLDKLALRIAESDRFKPGDRDGAPVAVAQSDELNLDGCAIRVTDRPGHITTQMWLSGPPKQRFQPYKNAPSEVALASASQSAGTPDHVATGISAPVALTAPVAEYSDEAREARYQGECMISVVVDAHGMPQNPRVVRPLGKGLDERALEAVMKYRFRPAVKNGMPVAVMVTIAVNFRL